MSDIQLREEDLLLGPSARGALRGLQRRVGGRLLTDLPTPYVTSVADFALDMIEETAIQGFAIAFDLTHVRDLEGVLQETGRNAHLVTSYELRFLRDCFPLFHDSVLFIKHDKLTRPPF